ncbi:hypothetical protein JIQ42_02413 [Leishmania sp. Namibia]|uniref:hypothetical protein n=1 Tax=Leishmania sp. Namibia TaxID=2802991 RepID=UPI001B5BA5F7|nr:hypothetical protein JIQ42_02413 [Leishmania sp. Namibia]
MLCRLATRTAGSGMHFCRAIESCRCSCRIPRLVSLSVSVRGGATHTFSSLPAVDFSQRHLTPDTASSRVAGEPSRSRRSPGHACADDGCRQYSRYPGRDSRRPPDVDASASTEPYRFPVGRALRYVQLGRRYHDQTEGQADLREWLAEIPFLPPADAMRHLSDSWSDGARDYDAPGTAANGPELVAEVSSFAKYHAHHVLIEFKALRRRIEEAKSCAQSARGSSQRPAASLPFNHRKDGVARDNEELSASSTTPFSPHPLPTHLVVALTQSLFHVTVLLHVSGLFGVADTHVERLLDVCFSASIFLAQDAAAAAAATRRQRGSRPESPSSSEATRQSGASPAVIGASPRSLHLHSLHWAIVHFAAGVLHWGLLEHTSPLQNLGRTQRPYERLLQVHAALLCEQTRRCVDHALWHELVLLKAGRRARAARDAWFMGPDAAAYSVLFGDQASSSEPCGNATNAGSLVRCVPARLQQRRLQLLPLLWLSLLCAQLPQREPPTVQISQTLAAPRGLPSRLDEAEVTWASARHAFAALLPLFSKDARWDVTAWAALHLLFLPHNERLRNANGIEAGAGQACAVFTAAATANASLAELCALLARVEHGGAMLELGLLLPGPTGKHAESSAYFHLAVFLRRWLDAATASQAASSSRVTPHVGLAGSNRLTSRGVSALVPSQTPLHTPDQLYRALRSIPLSALYLPSPTPSPSDRLSYSAVFAEGAVIKPSRQPLLSVTTEGARLLNQMLLRVLLQWRSDRRVRRVRQSSDSDSDGGGVPALSLPQKLSSAGSAEPIMPNFPRPVHMPFPETGVTGGRGEATKASQSGSPPVAHLQVSLGSPKESIISAAESRLRWERELVCVLEAALHLGALVNAGANGGAPRGDSSDRGAALIREFVAPTAQAAARALAEQLGGSLLPWRLLLLHCEGVSLTSTELQLLEALDATLRDVLLMSPPQRVHASDSEAKAPQTAVGALPMIYRVSINALMRTAP